MRYTLRTGFLVAHRMDARPRYFTRSPNPDIRFDFYWRIIILAAFVLACPVGYYAFNHFRKKTDPTPSFLLVIIAGLVESAGGLFVFFNEIADISNIVLIAGGLLIAGGIMPLV